MPAQITTAMVDGWIRTDGAALVRVVENARAHARSERQRVNAYIQPIFARYQFPVRQEVREKYGEFVKKDDDLYLCDDEELCATYFAECDQAHRAHGYIGPEGYCPALVAEHAVTKAEWALINSWLKASGNEENSVYGDLRNRMLETIIGTVRIIPKRRTA